MIATMPATAVYLEVGRSKVFACSVDWPGWCRAGRTEQAALEALADYAERYADVARAAGKRFARTAGDQLEVVERVRGSATTDFGAPGVVPALDAEPLTAHGARRQADLLVAAWSVLDGVAATAPPSLRKGPRGGGRDRDAMLQHVLNAEAAYARKIGVRHRDPSLGDPAAVRALRHELVATVRRARSGEPMRDNGWPARYAVRRIAWHVLDHAWEMTDKSTG